MLSSQIQSAWTLIKTLDLDLPSADDIHNVIILGMGGSAIGGDLVAGLIADECKTPIMVHRNYDLPAWVNENTLVIGSSYSGNTEETLSGWEQAGKRGAKRIAITTGGNLADSALTNQNPLIQFDYKSQPRAALGYSFTLLYGLLARIGLIATPADNLARAVKDLTNNNLEEAKATKTLTRHLAGGIPVILAAEHLSAVARRWTTQINENSKSWAIWNDYPELNHNLIVGLDLPQEAIKHNLIRIIQLDSAHYHPQNRKRMDITQAQIEQAGIPVQTFKPESTRTRLTELLQTVHMGDIISLQLAKKYKVDPTPVPQIEALKAKLAE